jgi:hypothetical protein
MNTITILQNDYDAVQSISQKIDNGTAVLADYKEYEDLLIKAGFTQLEIRSKMTEGGFYNYEELLKAKENPLTRQQRKWINVSIVAGLVVLSAVLGYWVAKGIVRITNK